MYRIWVLFLLAGLPFSLAAQDHLRQNTQQGSLIGNVLDQVSGRPLSFASLLLTRVDATATPTPLLADKNGGFGFEHLPFGYYRLTIEAVGFAKYELDSIHIYAERTDINLGDIKLNAAGTALNEVIVYA